MVLLDVFCGTASPAEKYYRNMIKAGLIDFGGMVDALPGLVWTTQADGRSDFVNRGWREYTGLGLDDAIDHGWQAAIHPDDLNSFVQSWNLIRQSGATGGIDARLRRFDGQYRWFVLRPSPLPGDDSAHRGWCWLGVDADESPTTDARLRRLFDMMPIQAGFLDAAGVLEFANLKSLKDFNMTYEELAAPITSGIIHADDLPVNDQSVTSLLTTSEWLDQEMRFLYPDGTYRWTRARVFPWRDAQGNIVRYVTCQLDVDDLKRAQALLAAEVKLLEMVARGEPLPQVLDALSRHVEELCSGCSCSVLSGAVAIHRSTPAPCSLHLYEEDLVDRFTKIAGIAIDRAQADTALQSRERELREALAQLSEGQRLSKTASFTSDIQVDRHRWSDEFYRMFEIDPDTPPHLDAVRARIHPNDLQIFNAEMERRIEGIGSEFNLRAVTPTGGLKHLRGVSQIIEHIAGRPVFMGVIQDITENKLAEEALNRSRSELAHVARVATLNAMTASIAHEVSQPLSGILTNANTCVRMLAGDPPNLSGAAETARRTIRDANRATEVVQRLRAMFSTKAPTKEVADLNDVAREVIALSTGELTRSGAILQTDFANNLPHVSVDRVQLQQVILNLLLNAADAMAGIEDRPRTLLVRTDQHDDGSVKLVVRDAGTGIDPDKIERLFDAFYTTKAKGMGVGLSISRSIIERHNGRLWAESNEGLGATFTFCIPSAAS